MGNQLIKEQIIEILESDYCDGGPTLGSIADKIENLVNQEVERRIKERMPSEEEIMRRVKNRKDYLREIGYPTQVLVKYGDAIIETIDWLRSRLTPQVTPQDTPQEQKTEGGTNAD